MNMSAPEIDTDEAEPMPDCVFADHLLDTLSHTLTTGAFGSAEELSDRWEAARTLLVAMRPRDPVEAVLAARAVAVHHASMDMYARAALPGTSDEAAIRLRSGAIAASHAFDAALLALEKRQAKSAQAASDTEVTTQGKAAPRPAAWTAQSPAASVADRRNEPAPNAGPARGTSTGGDQPCDATTDPPWRHWLVPIAARYCTYGGPDDAGMRDEVLTVAAPIQTVAVTVPATVD
jgi:hypothetical protein